MIFDYITAILELRLEVGINGFEHLPPGSSISNSSPDSYWILIDMRAEKNTQPIVPDSVVGRVQLQGVLGQC